MSRYKTFLGSKCFSTEDVKTCQTELATVMGRVNIHKQVLKIIRLLAGAAKLKF